MHILHVVGARPNFMKVAPAMAALRDRPPVQQTLVHTGQHYDVDMSEVFFRQLELPQPDVNLEVGSGTHARQTAQIMIRLEPVLLRSRPDLVLVYGDVNSTLAAALVCAKLEISMAHVEAGLRSFDRTMPEEINRLLTDQLSDLLFTHSSDADKNLAREGVPSSKIFRVGNVMIDTLAKLLPMARQSCIRQHFGLDNNRRPGSPLSTGSLSSARQSPARIPYGVVTLHRPSNVDDSATLKPIMLVLSEIAETVPLIFPVHPRTRQRLAELGLPSPPPGLRLTEPLGYLDFLALEESATFAITDSGGIQEETTYLGVPCVTVRENTERPVTITEGTNILVGRDPDQLYARIREILAGRHKTGRVPELWDGKSATRIAIVILESFSRG